MSEHLAGLDLVLRRTELEMSFARAYGAWLSLTLNFDNREDRAGIKMEEKDLKK